MNKKTIIWTLLLISSVSSATTHNLVHNLKDHHRTKRESFINLDEVPDLMYGLANSMRRGFHNVVHQGKSLRQRMLGLGSNFVKSAHKNTFGTWKPILPPKPAGGSLYSSNQNGGIADSYGAPYAPQYTSPPVYKNPSNPPPAAPAYHTGENSGTLEINFDDCDCHFGNSDSFKPLPSTGFNANIDTYGNPAGKPIVVVSKPTVITSSSSLPAPPSPSYTVSSIPSSSSLPAPPSPSYSVSSIPSFPSFSSSSIPSSSSFSTSSVPSSSSSFSSSSIPSSSSFSSSSNPSSSSSSNPSSFSSSIPSSSSSFSSFSSSIGTQPTVTYTKPIVQTFSSSFTPQPGVTTFNKPIVSQSSLPVITSSNVYTGDPIISQTSDTFSFPAESSYTVSGPISGTGPSFPSNPISFSQQSIGSSLRPNSVNSFPSTSSSFSSSSSSFPSSSEILHTTSPPIISSNGISHGSSSISSSITNPFSSNKVPQIQVTNDISTDPIYTPSIHVDSSPAPQSVNEIDHHDLSEEKKKFINLDKEVLKRVLTNTLYYKDLTSFKKKYHKDRKIHKKLISTRR